MTVEYVPSGVCSRLMQISVEDDVITDVQIIGGCNGNLQGLSRLLIGMPVDDAIEKMEGIECNGRGTSCPDQLATALKMLPEAASGE